MRLPRQRGLMKKIFLLLLFSLTITANPYKTINSILPLELENQFDNMIKIDKKIAYMMVIFDKKSYQDMEVFLDKQPKNFLKKRKIVYLNNTTNIPPFLFKLFVKPNMKRKKYDILLIKDKKLTEKFNFKQNRVSLYEVKEGKVEKIEFLTPKELGKRLLSL